VSGARLPRRAELRRVQILNRVVDRYAAVPPGYRYLAVFGVAFLIRFGVLVLTDFDHYSRITLEPYYVPYAASMLAKLVGG
jgi:hypothetical protein